MSESDDDVIIIDSTLPSTSVSSGRSGGSGEARESIEGSDAMVTDVAGRVTPTSSSRVGFPKTASPPRAAFMLDTFCRKVEENTNALPRLRAEANTQTDSAFSSGAATLDSTASLHRDFRQMEVALGIRVSTARRAAPQAAESVVKQLVCSWRNSVGGWKRFRSHGETRDDTNTDHDKQLKRESDSGAEVCRDLRDPSSLCPRDCPEWAVGLESALERCQNVLESPYFTLLARQQEQCSILRAPNSPLLATGAFPAATQVGPTASAPVSSAPVVADDSHGGLLREAELICAREGTHTLFPIYDELHALRRMRAEREQQAALTVEKQLEWEQRRLTDMLAECDAQLDILDTNFINSCKTGLAPVEVLQQRMEALNSFRRQLESHASAMVPLIFQGAPATSKSALPTADLTTTTSSRPMGLVGDALLECMADERRLWEKRLEVLQARLDEQTKRSAELQACYVQANMQLQASLDKDNYVNKEVLNAAKAQQRADMQTLVERLGWFLVNSTSDVLSLRHPGTGNMLHVNHAYSTINGEQCENIPKTLAAYILKHGDAIPKAMMPATSLPLGSPAGLAQSVCSQNQLNSQSVSSSPLALEALHHKSEVESGGTALSPDGTGGTEERASAAADGTMASTASSTRSTPSRVGATSPPSSRQSSLPSGTPSATRKELPIPLDSMPLSADDDEVIPQSSMEEVDFQKEEPQEGCGSVGSSADDPSEGGEKRCDIGGYEEERDSATSDGQDDVECEKHAVGEFASFSNIQAKEASGNAPSSNVISEHFSSGFATNDEQRGKVLPATYESYFSNSPLWENEE